MTFTVLGYYLGCPVIEVQEITEEQYEQQLDDAVADDREEE